MSIELAPDEPTGGPIEETQRNLPVELRMMQIGDTIRHSGYAVTRVTTGFIYRWEGGSSQSWAPTALCYVPYAGMG